jgi:hypothetical protein
MSASGALAAEIAVADGKTGPQRLGNSHRLTWVQRLGPNVAIACDDYQWIVLQAGASGGGYRREGQWWKAVAFLHSSKAALLACIESKGLKLSAAGRAALARQDARIFRWQMANSVATEGGDR